jgi:molecular chaperone GrpE (heat shock protein)
MNTRTAPALNKIPFLVGDVLLLGLAVWILQTQPHPLSLRALALCASLAALGVVVSVLPFVLEYKAALKCAEAEKLSDTVAQINQLEQLAKQISAATGQWQDVQTAAGKTAGAAKEIADQMAAEIEGFTDFAKQAHEGEKASLRLEVEKLRRSEGEWLQILVRVLDHVFALQQAGARSGQPELAAQLGNFQNACRDVARRIGLTPFAAEADERFDDKRHRLLDSEKSFDGAVVGETLAPGYTFQSQMLRPALVRLKPTVAAAVESAGETPAAEPTLL